MVDTKFYGDDRYLPGLIYNAINRDNYTEKPIYLSLYDTII